MRFPTISVDLPSSATGTRRIESSEQVAEAQALETEFGSYVHSVHFPSGDWANFQSNDFAIISSCAPNWLPLIVLAEIVEWRWL